MACAGFGVAVVIFLLGITGGIEAVNRVVPWPVVRGMQLGLGLSMCMKGVQMIETTRQWLGFDSYLTAILGAGFVLLGLQAEKRVKIPVALVLFVVGAGMATGKVAASDLSYVWAIESPVAWAAKDFTAVTFMSGFIKVWQ